MFRVVNRNPGAGDAAARGVVAKALARAIILSAFTLTVSMPAGALTQEEEAGKQIFERTCLACHSIGQGPRVGPDLKDINKRREHDWLVTPTGKFNAYNTANDVY